jgi:Cof subfamily protein (haloacid dehalogenase superfamily)
MNIKAIILDIDGVIIGEKIGYNSPSPHQDVISALKQIKSKGVSITLCTAKPHFAIRDIIKDAKLDNLHITDGGGVIIDPLNENILKANIIPSDIASKVLETYIENNVYTEFYTVNDYYIQKNQACNITTKHAHVLQQEPQISESIVETANFNQLTKVMPIAKDEEDKKRLTELFRPFEKELVLSWGIHPVALPLQFGIITAKGISKKNAAEEIMKQNNISFTNVLGVGDSTSDWQFIQLCKFSGAMGNASNELKELVISKETACSYICPSVDENGILNLFQKFDLL